MTRVDTTGVGIALGLVASFAYAVIRALRQRTFDLGITVLVFLAAFTLPGGTLLIAAGLSGNSNALPLSWREHVAVAGIVVIALTAHFLFRSTHSAWSGTSAERQTNQEEE